MLDCQVAILENAIARYTITGIVPEPMGTDHPSITPFGAFKTKDGKIVIAIGNDKLFNRFCNVIGDLNIPNEYNSNKKRNLNINKLRERIEKYLKKQTSKYWLNQLSKERIPSAKINSISELTNNKQIIHRKMLLDYSLGSKKDKGMKITNMPFNFSFVKNNSQVKKAPNLDENRKDILKFFEID